MLPFNSPFSSSTLFFFISLCFKRGDSAESLRKKEIRQIWVWHPALLAEALASSKLEEVEPFKEHPADFLRGQTRPCTPWSASRELRLTPYRNSQQVGSEIGAFSLFRVVILFLWVNCLVQFINMLNITSCAKKFLRVLWRNAGDVDAAGLWPITAVSVHKQSTR